MTSSFARIIKKIDTPAASFYVFSPARLTWLFLLKQVKPSPDRKMVTLLAFDNLFPPLRHSRKKS